jgi:Prophage tail length tape measure protein.
MAYAVNMNQININQLNVAINVTENFIVAVQKAQESVDGFGKKTAQTAQNVSVSAKVLDFSNRLATGLNTAAKVISEVGGATVSLVKSSREVSSKVAEMNNQFAKTGKSSQSLIDGVQKSKNSLEHLGETATEATKKVEGTSKASGVGSKIANGLSTAKKAIGDVGNATAGFLKDCVDGASKAEKINLELAQTIKSTGGAAGVTAQEVGKMASQLSNTTTFAAGTIQAGQNVLLTFTNIGKDVFPKASQAMLDMAQKMGTGPVEASKVLGKALDDPTNGIEDLIGAGAKFTEEQKRQIQVMQKVGDMAGAQKVILSSLNNEFGGSAADAANTYEGRMTQLSNVINDIKTNIGMVLLPYVKKVAEVFLGAAQAIKNVPQPIMDIIAKTLGLTAVFGTLIGGFGMFKSVIGTFFSPLSGVMGLFSKFPIPIMLVVGVIALLAAAFATNFGGIRDIVMGVFNKISGAVKSAIDVFKKTGSAAEGIGALFSNLFGAKVGEVVTKTMKLITTIVKSLVEFIKAHMPQIKNTIQNVFKGIQSVWNSVLKPVLMFLVESFGKVVDWIQKHLPQIKIVVQNVFKGIQLVWNSILKPVLAFAIEMFKKVVDWIKANWPLIKQTITTVMTAIKTVIATVLNVIMSFWNAHGQTIKTYVGAVFNNIKTIISTVLSVVTGVIKTVMQIINGDWSGAWNTIKETVSKVFNGAVDIVKNVINAISAVFKDIAKTALTWGKDMIMGIVDGIKGAVGYIEDAVKGVADKIRSFLHFSVPDQGPLTDYESWMPDFMKGMGTGIKVNTHLVTDPVKDLSVGIKTNMNKNLSGGSKAGGVNSTVTGAAKEDSGQNGFAITIAKLADSIIIREEGDIDKIATALANKLTQTALGMG